MDTNMQWWHRPVSAPEPPPPDPAPAFQPPPRSGFRRRLSAIGAATVALLAKFKAVLLLLPKLKLFASTGTIVVSLAAYALLWGWAFAAGFIALLFVHEMGHVIALRREGLKASAPMFIPFMGAVIAARSLGRNALA
jgi:Zn-dependent protease